MKKLHLKKRKAEPKAPPSRITNETVAEHREQILAGGRRFKYPHQYERHKVVFNVIVISIVTLILMGVLIWWQLYPAQNTSTFFYRVTRILPVPVANVDGAQVRYSDYLMSLSGSLHYLEETERVNLGSDDGKRRIEFYKRLALDGAIADTYAAKLAAEADVSISDEKVNEVVEAGLNTVSGKISQDVYDDSTYSTFGYTADEYRHIIRRALLRQEMAYRIDNQADTVKKEAEALISASSKVDLAKVAAALDKKGYKVQVGASGLVPNTNFDGGLTQVAKRLQKGETSEFIRSTTGDGYYLVQLLETRDTQLSYAFIKIALTEFDERLKTLRQNDQIDEYISVDESSDEVIRQ
jgi:hypothetical protein